jgi:molybdopterin/thiamine biosynthesis adenylyltransferase
MTPEPWWIRYPDALEAEKSALGASGYVWQINQDAWDEGRLIIEIDVARNNETIKLTAEYPDTFPYFPPSAQLDTVRYSRHQHPVGKNLCLLAREGEDWQPGTDTLAKLLDEQLPKIEEINNAVGSLERVAEQEDHVGEPLSAFLSYLQNCAIIVPDQTPAPEQTGGRLLINIRKVTHESGTTPFVNGIVQKISDLAGKTLIDFPVSLPVFSQPLNGFWLRLPERPTIADELQLQRELFAIISKGHVPFKKATNAAKRGQVLVAGFVYKDERTWRQNADDWIFLVARVVVEAKGMRSAQFQLHFVKADWGGEQAWMRRAPALLPLRNKSALVVGLGSLGSPLVLQLARAGIGRLHLIDCDHLQVGNTIRWALGWQYAGLDKVASLARHIMQEYPYTEVSGYNVRIGANSRPTAQFFSDYDLLRTLGSQAEIIVDASANYRVSYFLSDLARELNKPYVWLTTTHGAAGGVVGRIIPNETHGCWHCFQHGLHDKTIGLPQDDGSAEIQPGGCSQPTFIGAGLDSDEIALLASRLSVATLTVGEANGYPDFSWNVAVADLNRDGCSIAPDWTTYPLEVNPACAACKAT